VELAVELLAHAELLGLTPASPRLVSATVGRDLVARLAVERDDVVLIGTLAGWTLAEEPQALARSISAAAPVAVAVRSATWSVLEAVAGIGVSDQRHGAAQAMMAALSAVAAAEELHSPLAPALTAAVKEAARILSMAKPSSDVKPADETGATVVERTAGLDEGGRSGVPQRFTVNDIRLEGVDDQFDELRAAVRAAMKQDPGRVLNVEWWLQ
jgi:hypothetical protein